MELALAKAEDGDCVFVSVRNSNHFGAAAPYASMGAEAGMIGIATTIGGINHMAPWGGAEAMLGNNPLAVAFPAGHAPPSIVLDMACSVAARGKIIIAAKEGRPIPPDWAVGPNGQPTTDPVQALAGFVRRIHGRSATGQAKRICTSLPSSLSSAWSG